jgi:hypothetical protein
LTQSYALAASTLGGPPPQFGLPVQAFIMMYPLVGRRAYAGQRSYAPASGAASRTAPEKEVGALWAGSPAPTSGEPSAAERS